MFSNNLGEDVMALHAQVRYELLGELLHGADIRKQLAASILINWLIGPALMTGLAWATLPDLPSYRNGARGLTRPLLLAWRARGTAHPHDRAAALHVQYQRPSLWHRGTIAKPNRACAGQAAKHFSLTGPSGLHFLKFNHYRRQPAARGHRSDSCEAGGLWNMEPSLACDNF